MPADTPEENEAAETYKLYWHTAAADAARWREIALALASDTIRVIGGEEGPWRVHDCRGPWTGRRDSHPSREAAMLAWCEWQKQTPGTVEPTT